MREYKSNLDLSRCCSIKLSLRKYYTQGRFHSFLVLFLQASPNLVQCPFNTNHYVPSSSLKDHSEKCQYATVLDTDSYKIDWDELSALKVGGSFLYQNGGAEAAHVGNVFSSGDRCMLLRETVPVQVSPLWRLSESLLGACRRLGEWPSRARTRRGRSSSPVWKRPSLHQSSSSSKMHLK